MLVGLGREHDAVLPALVDTARDAAPAMRRRMALFALRDLAPEREQTAGALLAALEDPDADVRRAALACMGRLERPFPAAFRAALGAARAHADPRMRRIAVAVLPGLTRQLPDEAPRVRALLESLLESDDPSLARAATGSLAQLAPPGDAR